MTKKTYKTSSMPYFLNVKGHEREFSAVDVVERYNQNFFQCAFDLKGSPCNLYTEVTHVASQTVMNFSTLAMSEGIVKEFTRILIERGILRGKPKSVVDVIIRTFGEAGRWEFDEKEYCFPRFHTFYLVTATDTHTNQTFKFEFWPHVTKKSKYEMKSPCGLTSEDVELLCKGIQDHMASVKVIEKAMHTKNLYDSLESLYKVN